MSSEMTSNYVCAARASSNRLPGGDSDDEQERNIWVCVGRQGFGGGGNGYRLMLVYRDLWFE
jgi:hypothetical protein